jgi:hypothetical protein
MNKSNHPVQGVGERGRHRHRLRSALRHSAQCEAWPFLHLTYGFLIIA